MISGVAEEREQKSWWRLSNVCHHNWVTWLNYGLHHEEDIKHLIGLFTIPFDLSPIIVRGN